MLKQKISQAVTCMVAFKTCCDNSTIFFKRRIALFAAEPELDRLTLHPCVIR